MSHSRLFQLLLGLLISLPAAAEVKPIVEHIDSAHASPEFKFKSIPAPSKTDAASKAKVSLVSGSRDPNSADIDALIDGVTPGEADEPDQNFFFDESSDGGRFLIDLGSSIQIREINVYSWHPSTRAPQLFKVYGSNDPSTKNQKDLEKSGWTVIASVDTRPRKPDGSLIDDDDAMGGQYGVSLSEAGKYRCLLFETMRTEDRDDWGNTFFSEIDVIDAAAPATKSSSAKENVFEGQFATIDVSAAPDLADWAQHKLLPVCDQWYPKIEQMLPSDGFVAPQHMTVQFRADLPRGTPAMTSADRISCNIDWFRRNVDGEATGAVVHEMVHVVQQYHSRNNPGWLVEGIADYVRWFQFEPEKHGAEVRDPEKAKYDASYRITANFLNYVTEHADKQIVAKLNAAMRQGRYSADLWKTSTGKSVEQLASEWKESLKTRQPM